MTDWYDNVQKFIDGDHTSGKNPPKLYCDSDFMAFQVATDVLLHHHQDNDNDRVRIGGRDLTLGKWLQTSPTGQRPLQEAWYFKAQSPASYFTLLKSVHPAVGKHPIKGDVPFKVSDQPHLCDIGMEAATMEGIEAVFPAGETTSQREQTPKVILCNRAILGSANR